MRPASIIIIATILYLAFTKTRKEMIRHTISLLVFFELFANAGVFLVIGNQEFQYSEFVWFVLLILIALDIFNHRLSVKRTALFLLLCTCVILCVIAEGMLFSDYNNRSVLVGMRIIVCAALVLYVDSAFDWMDFSNSFSSQLIGLQKVNIVILLVEEIVKTTTHSNIWNEAVMLLFGTSINQVTTLLIRGGLYSLQGLCKEPSHLAFALFFCSLFDLIVLKEHKDASILLVLNCLFLVISGSFSSLLFVICIAFAYFVSTSISMGKISIVLLAGFMACMLVIYSSEIPIIDYYFDRAVSAMNIANLDPNTSEGVRLSGIMVSLKQFRRYPISGCGLGNNVFTGAIPSMLAAGGLLICIPLSAMMLLHKTGTNKKVGIIVAMIIALCLTMDFGTLYCGSVGLLTLFSMNKVVNGRSNLI